MKITEFVFTREMRLAVSKVQEITREFGCDEIRPEHVFLSLLRLGTRTKLWAMLVRAQLNEKDVENKLINKMRTGTNIEESDKNISAKLMKILNIALQERSTGIGVKQFFVACIVEVNNVPYEVLHECGFNLVAIARRLH